MSEPRPASTERIPAFLMSAGLAFLVVAGLLSRLLVGQGKEQGNKVLMAIGVAAQFAGVGGLSVIGLGFYLQRRGVLRALVLAAAVLVPVAFLAWALHDSCAL